jgi:hypothetical protein
MVFIICMLIYQCMNVDHIKLLHIVSFTLLWPPTYFAQNNNFGPNNTTYFNFHFFSMSLHNWLVVVVVTAETEINLSITHGYNLGFIFRLVQKSILYQTIRNILLLQVVKYPNTRLPWWLNYVWCHLILLGSWYGTSFMSPFWCIEFGGCSQISGKFVHPWATATEIPIALVHCIVSLGDLVPEFSRQPSGLVFQIKHPLYTGHNATTQKTVTSIAALQQHKTCTAMILICTRACMHALMHRHTHISALICSWHLNHKQQKVKNK